MAWGFSAFFVGLAALFGYLHLTVEGPDMQRRRAKGRKEGGSLSLAYAILFSAFALAIMYFTNPRLSDR